MKCLTHISFHICESHHNTSQHYHAIVIDTEVPECKYMTSNISLQKLIGF
jgi:hypothetical protein